MSYLRKCILCFFFPNWRSEFCHRAERRCVLTRAKMIQLTAADHVNTISSMGCRRCAELLPVDPSDGRDSASYKMICLADKDSSSALSSRHFALFLFPPKATCSDPDNHYLNTAGYFRLTQAGPCAVLFKCFEAAAAAFTVSVPSDQLELPCRSNASATLGQRAVQDTVSSF